MVMCVVCLSLSCVCCNSLFSPKDINIQISFHQNEVLIQKKNIALTLGSGDKATLTLRYVELEKAERDRRERDRGRFEKILQSWESGNKYSNDRTDNFPIEPGS